MSSDLGRHIEAVACRLWGDPNRSLSRGSQLRWGKNGARSVDTAKGVWTDHHGNHPSGVENGGVVALIMRELSLSNSEAVEWMRNDMGLDVGGGPVLSPKKFNGKSNGHASEGARGILVASYDYVDETGSLVCQTLRFEKPATGDAKPAKTFSQRRPDGNGGWIWNLKGVRLVPYRLPELTEALALERRVFVVEGEKAADRLWAEGTPATTNPMGAGKWPSSFADFFGGAAVTILPDNDDPGRKHAVNVAISLASVAGSLNILPLPGLAEKEDIVEWLDERGGSVARLHELAEAAAPFAFDASTDEAAPREQPLAPLRIIDPSLWEGRPAPQRQWLVENWIPQGVVTGLYGDGGIGKTLLLQQLQASAATGLPWLGMHVEECVSLGVYCEDSEDELHRRMESIVTAYGCEYRLLAAMPMLARMGEDNLLMVFDSKGRGELTPFYNQVRELALDIRAKLIGVDTAADTFGGNENDRGQVRQFVQRALGGLARDTCGSLVLLAHPSVAGMASGEGTGGNTGWSNAFRSRLYTERPKAVDGEDTDPDARVLSRKKANYASRDDAILMRWVNGVLTIPPPAANAFRPLCEDVYLSLLESCTASGNTPSPKFSASTYAPTMFSKLSKAQRQGYHKGEFERAQTALFNRQVITFEEVGPPARRRHVIVKTEMPE